MAVLLVDILEVFSSQVLLQLSRSRCDLTLLALLCRNEDHIKLFSVRQELSHLILEEVLVSGGHVPCDAENPQVIRCSGGIVSLLLLSSALVLQAYGLDAFGSDGPIERMIIPDAEQGSKVE